jgi:TatD DNase family protein
VLIDSHCHLIYLDDVDARLAAARAAGVGGFLSIGVKSDEHTKVRSIAARHPDVWITAGIHPDGVAEGDDLGWIERAAAAHEIVGVGETGLDYYRLDPADDTQRARQRERFRGHLEIATAAQLPVVVHTRAAADDTLAAMRDVRSAIGVMHCFTEPWSVASAALDLGYYISISGIVTFKNAETIRDVARRVPSDRLLVETDSPWLAPVPKRGKPNEPAFVAHTAKFVAALRGVTDDALAATTTANFFRLFSRARRA